MAEGINAEVAAAMKYAREHSGMTPEQFAREVNRVAGSPGALLDANEIEEIEAGEAGVLAKWLVAAARIAAQPVSVILGELDAFEVTIPMLARRLAAVEARLDSPGLS